MNVMLWLVILLITLFVADFFAKSGPQQITTARIYALLLLGGLCLLVESSPAWSLIRQRRHEKSHRQERFSPNDLLLSNIILAALLFIALIGEPEIVELIGFSNNTNALPAISIGLAAYALILLLYNFFTRLLNCSELTQRATDNAIRRLRPRRRGDHWKFYTALCLFNPIVEELIYRGILVSLLAYTLDNTPLAIAVGLTASITSHLYQGWTLVPFHLLFHGTAITLLFSQGGLLSCIAFHVAGDLVPVVWNAHRMQRRLKQLRKRRQTLC